MQGDATAIQHLNRILRNELTAISQYFLHARMCRNWGLKEMGEHEYRESIDEMKHADKLVERILFLEGLPNLQELNRLRIGQNPKEVLEGDLALEMEAMQDLREAIVHAEGIRDFVTRDLCQDILESEEEHVDWLETQLDLIDRMGLQNFVQRAAGGLS
ncbi:bacterioferritin [Geothrix sp. 21YS21S-4]|uniref:bacterioferritin n=1 Tax=Geothrix sp. 21YS21S-4 TaxID=3068889 RepID=UPI0027B92582|nr:bacterioferritin [Geothrix sp. 21YS21S-4]